MKRLRKMERMLQRFGAPTVVVVRGEGVDCHAFVQPMRYKNKIYMDSQITGIGTVDESCFLYIGPPDVPLVEGTTASQVVTGGQHYTVVKREVIYAGEQPAYMWAVLRLMYQGG